MRAGGGGRKRESGVEKEGEVAREGERDTRSIFLQDRCQDTHYIIICPLLDDH